MTAFEQQLAALTASFQAARPELEAETAQGVFDRYLAAVETPHRPRCRALRSGYSEGCNCGRADVVARATDEYQESFSRIKSSGVELFTSERLEVELQKWVRA